MNIAIIAAAGSGKRMASDRPKQFLSLAGIPIIIHTLNAFEQCDSIQEIVVVVPAEHSADLLSLASKFRLRKLARVVPGGATRAESVKRGLLSIRSATAEIVAVHDGVRPFVTPEEIGKTVAGAQQHGAAILVAAATDTIKQVSGGSVVNTLERKNLRHALTPQCFRYELLRRAYDVADVSDSSLTDDSALVEQLGERVAIIEGSARNIKITTQRDLMIAESIVRSGPGS
jgi:2-C-methyl-D-erythritol 4-phosphate cytidylyltransferase